MFTVMPWFTRFIWWKQTGRQVATDAETKSTDLAANKLVKPSAHVKQN